LVGGCGGGVDEEVGQIAELCCLSFDWMCLRCGYVQASVVSATSGLDPVLAGLWVGVDKDRNRFWQPIPKLLEDIHMAYPLHNTGSVTLLQEQINEADRSDLAKELSTEVLEYPTFRWEPTCRGLASYHVAKR
jgi:hypothetical protein